jgi:hypothetical protein
MKCDGVDANAEQIRTAMAWVFDRYVTDRSLCAVQDEARGARLELARHPLNEALDYVLYCAENAVASVGVEWRFLADAGAC